MSRSIVVRFFFATAMVFGAAVVLTHARQLASRPADVQIRALESPGRVTAQRVDEILKRLDLRPGVVVADIGAGTGVFARPLARAVGPTGKVYGVDIVPELLTYLDDRSRQEQIPNIHSVLGAADDPKIPAREVDIALFNDVLHHIEHRREYLRALAGYMKPDSLMAIVEFDNRGNRAQLVEGVPMVDKAELSEWLAELGYRPLQEYTDLFTNKWYVIYRRGTSIQLTRHASPPPLPRPAAPAVVSRQPEDPRLSAGTGSLSGVVLDRTLQEPVSEATVSISLDGGRNRRSATTEVDGTFRFDGVPSGNFYVTVTKAGYAQGAYNIGGSYERGSPSFFELDDGESARDVELFVSKQAVVRGRVLDENGSPLQGARVQLKRVATVGGRPRYLEIGSAPVTTDASGRYVFPAVIPATYILTVLAAPARGLPTVFDPGTLSADNARSIVVTAGDEIDHGDLRVPTPPTVSVSGRVLGLDPSITNAVAEILFEQPQLVTGMPVTSATIAPGGAFAFPRVPEGRYVIRVRHFPRPQSQPGFRAGMQTIGLGGAGSFSASGTGSFWAMSELPSLLARVPLVVGSTSVADLEIPLSVGARIRGTLVFRGTTPPPDAAMLNSTGLIVRAGPLTELPSFQLARLESDGTFVTVGLPPDIYSLGASPNLTNESWTRTWLLDSMSVGGRPVRAIELGRSDVNDVVLTYVDNPGTVAGLVRNTNGAVVPGARVHVFPRDPQSSMVGFSFGAMTLRASRKGAFETALPSGDYFIVATNPGEADDAELEALARRGNAVTIRGGERRTADLTVR